MLNIISVAYMDYGMETSGKSVIKYSISDRAIPCQAMIQPTFGFIVNLVKGR